jgi:hypothetical protein
MEPAQVPTRGPAEPAPEPERKPYVAPRLVAHGHARRLTGVAVDNPSILPDDEGQ